MALGGSAYGLAVGPAGALSPNVAGLGAFGVIVGLGVGVPVGVGLGLGVGVGVTVGVDPIVIVGGVVKPFGQIDRTTPAARGDAVGVGLVIRTTPTWLL